ncbi:Uncharacterised protein [Escherichia coli]|uniref:Uncharacterized protein n=1 Tax=Escherichia coli TaxID=562 RepID=A0A377BDI5_ECOLX|nr:Uncharacterised protein [Escherichia coli]
MHLDSRDLSLIIDADHPIAQDVIMRTRETGNFTYADLNQILVGYERLSAASEYAITGVNKKLRVDTANNGKWLRIAARPLKHISLNILVFVIILAQLGVAAGICRHCMKFYRPTVTKAFFKFECQRNSDADSYTQRDHYRRFVLCAAINN